jgi:putative transcriptional regulator
MDLENKLKLARKSQKVTQLELAQQVGVSRQSIYAIEASKSEPSLSLALKIAKALSVSVEEIFWLSGDKKTELGEEISPFTIF